MTGGCLRAEPQYTTFFALGLALLVVFQPTTASPGDDCSEESLQHLVQLIDERLSLARDVARYKWSTNLPIEDLDREQAIIENLGRQAAELGLPVGWSEAFFRAQIEASKTEQRALFTTWRQTHPRGFNHTPHLATVTRPKLDALTAKLFAALASTWPQIRNPRCQPVMARLVASRQQTSALHNPSALTVAAAPLTAAGAPE